jgi:hypothetical protein
VGWRVCDDYIGIWLDIPHVVFGRTILETPSAGLRGRVRRGIDGERCAVGELEGVISFIEEDQASSFGRFRLEHCSGFAEIAICTVHNASVFWCDFVGKLVFEDRRVHGEVMVPSDD